MKKSRRWMIPVGIIIILVVLFFTWSIREANSQAKYIYRMMNQFLMEDHLEAKTIDITYNQFTQKRTIKVVFKDEPEAVYYYHYNFKVSEAEQQPKYGGVIKTHPEKGKHYKYDIVPK
ncbi:MAG: DUF3139 domain-containing protein [Heyndrickxia sp.]